MALVKRLPQLVPNVNASDYTSQMQGAR